MNLAIVAFVAITYGLSIMLSVVALLAGGHPSLPGISAFAMFVPTIAVMFVRSRTQEGVRIDWIRFPIAYLPLALSIIPVTTHAAMLYVVSKAGPLPWAGWLTPAGDGLYYTPETRGWGVVTTQGLIARLMLNAIVGVVAVSALALFEEIGWRGWLLPQFMRHMSARRSVIATAVVWALWHLPFGLSGIQHIDGMSPMRVAVLVPFGTFAAGLVIGWLWVRTQSIWIAAIAHGALNSWGQYAFKFMEDFDVPDQSVVLGVGFVAVACVGTSLLTFGMSARTASDPRRGM